MRYSVEGQELTNIGDALRRRFGEKKEVAVPDNVRFSKTPNVDDKGVYDNNRITGTFVDTVKIEGATRIIVDLNLTSGTTRYSLYVVKGEYTEDNFPVNEAQKFTINNSIILTFDDTDSVTFLANVIDTSYAFHYYAKCIGEAYHLNTYETKDMAQAIDDIPEAPTDEELCISGNCTYKFSYDGWNWFLDKYKNRLTTKNITSAERMFNNNTNLKEIPFKINIKDAEVINLQSVFYGMSNLEKAPVINLPNPVKSTITSIFQSCPKVQDLNGVFENEEEFGRRWQSFVNTGEFGQHYASGFFQTCQSLRTVPTWFYQFRLNPESTSYIYNSYSIYYRTFYSCKTLDEVRDFPVWSINAAQTKSMIEGLVYECTRLKAFTFETNPDGTPIITKWKNQTFDFTSTTGWTTSSFGIVGYGGITADKEVKNDDTYQALKNDPDWFATKVEYSRYNHDSAVETINSLPDCSAYLATAGGTNTIKFKGAAGSKTDGGAINTLTAEEIAVATAKGWTVTLV